MRVFVGTRFLALLAAFRTGPGFLLLDFLLVAVLAIVVERLDFVVLALDLVLDLALDLALAALAFVALAAGGLRRFFAARFRRSGVAATGGTISGSETRPSAASGI